MACVEKREREEEEEKRREEGNGNKEKDSSWFPGRQVSSHLLALWPGAVTCKSFKYPHFKA